LSLLDLLCSIRLVRCSRLHGSRLLLATEKLEYSASLLLSLVLVVIRTRLLVTVVLLKTAGILGRGVCLSCLVDGIVADVNLELLGHLI
ncbi:hypothetical protein PMAYCL1PPCAC_23085, partial [Pristionchus mayeri]